MSDPVVSRYNMAILSKKRYNMAKLLGLWGGARGTATHRSRPEQPHKQERHHTLTQNLKAMGLWVLLLIRCSTFTILSDVGHITHVSPLLVSPQTDRHCSFTAVVAFCANGPAASVVPFVEPRSNTTVGSVRGARGTSHIEARTTAQARETPHSLPKTLRQ